jgi:hypothetical protein
MEYLLSHLPTLIGHIKIFNTPIATLAQEKDGLGCSFVYDILSENNETGRIHEGRRN